MSVWPERAVSATAWELIGHWGAGRRVVLALARPSSVARVSGFVVHVASSFAFAVIEADGGEDVHVPLALVRSVRRPHFSEDEVRESRRARPIEMPAAQLSLW